jgi:hypothetical protein
MVGIDGIVAGDIDVIPATGFENKGVCLAGVGPFFDLQ